MLKIDELLRVIDHTFNLQTGHFDKRQADLYHYTLHLIKIDVLKPFNLQAKAKCFNQLNNQVSFDLIFESDFKLRTGSEVFQYLYDIWQKIVNTGDQYTFIRVKGPTVCLSNKSDQHV